MELKQAKSGLRFGNTNCMRVGVGLRYRSAPTYSLRPIYASGRISFRPDKLQAWTNIFFFEKASIIIAGISHDDIKMINFMALGGIAPGNIARGWR